MAEYYELVLKHRVQSGGRYDPDIEQPIVVKGFISPLMQKSVFYEHGDLIDDMYCKLKEYWMQTREEGDHHD